MAAIEVDNPIMRDSKNACDVYTVDMKASFGVCTCGFTQADHSAASRAKQAALRQHRTHTHDDNSYLVLQCDSGDESSDRKAACEAYEVDIVAGFGLCTCGLHKAEHSENAQLPRKSSNPNSNDHYIFINADDNTDDDSSDSKPACEAYEVDVVAGFGLCKCGLLKAEHSDNAQSPRKSSNPKKMPVPDSDWFQDSKNQTWFKRKMMLNEIKKQKESPHRSSGSPRSLKVKRQSRITVMSPTVCRQQHHSNKQRLVGAAERRKPATAPTMPMDAVREHEVNSSDSDNDGDVAHDSGSDHDGSNASSAQQSHQIVYQLAARQLMEKTAKVAYATASLDDRNEPLYDVLHLDTFVFGHEWKDGQPSSGYETPSSTLSSGAIFNRQSQYEEIENVYDLTADMKKNEVCSLTSMANGTTLPCSTDLTVHAEPALPSETTENALDGISELAHEGSIHSKKFESFLRGLVDNVSIFYELIEHNRVAQSAKESGYENVKYAQGTDTVQTDEGVYNLLSDLSVGATEETMQAARIYSTVKSCQDLALEPLYDATLAVKDKATYAKLRAARQEAVYVAIGQQQHKVCGRAAEEKAIMALYKSRERQDIHINAHIDAMSKHKAAYDGLWTTWQNGGWITAVNKTHETLKPRFSASFQSLMQPNPWHEKTNSKKYLISLLEAYKGTDSRASVVARIFEECRTIADGFTGVDFKPGSTKSSERSIEKSLAHRGHFHSTHDYSRLAYVVSDLDMFPGLISKIAAVNSDVFTMVRVKNRFDVGYDAKLSAGYRDYQVLVKSPEGWIVELQIIPEEVYKLKGELGHKNYTSYRFILECAQRARQHAI